MISTREKYELCMLMIKFNCDYYVHNQVSSTIFQCFIIIKLSELRLIESIFFFLFILVNFKNMIFLLQVLYWLKELENVLQEEAIKKDSLMQINISIDLYEIRFRLWAHVQYRLIIEGLILFMGELMYSPICEVMDGESDETPPLNLCVRDQIISVDDSDSDIEIIRDVRQELNSGNLEIILSD